VNLIKFQEASTEYLRLLDKRMKQKIGNVEIARFNPFQGVGLAGNNSFSASFINEDGNGVVISGLHTRERTNVFVKATENWQSQSELSKEEKGVIQKSKSKTENAK